VPTEARLDVARVDKMCSFTKLARDERMRTKPIVMLCAVFALSCGGGAGSGSRDAGPEMAADAISAQTRVDPELPLKELSSELRERVCDALAQSYNRTLSGRAYLEASCTVQAWPLSWIPANGNGDVKGDPEKCKTAVARCLEQHGTLAEASPTQTLGADLVHPTRCTLPPDGVDLGVCDANVGNLETCAAALAVELGPRLKSTSCDQLGDPNELDSMQPAIDLATLPECAALREHCMALALTLETQPDGQKPRD
jgi:hypothetical protein